ncbi:isoprenylcysteine carboxylmethyltransferase family protein [bacterium]|nr:isoprenylcysteine carboxylmethyltransferase family protein [bacterium]
MSTKTKSRFFVTIQLLCTFGIMLSGEIIVTGVVNWILFSISGLLALWAFSINKPHSRLIFPEPPPDSRLLTTGPYRFIRHPMYSALLLATLVWTINDFSWLRFIVWLILLANACFKLTFEEKLLAARFPDYSEYITKTKRLIPFVFTLI